MCNSTHVNSAHLATTRQETSCLYICNRVSQLTSSINQWGPLELRDLMEDMIICDQGQERTRWHFPVPIFRMVLTNLEILIDLHMILYLKKLGDSLSGENRWLPEDLAARTLVRKAWLEQVLGLWMNFFFNFRSWNNNWMCTRVYHAHAAWNTCARPHPACNPTWWIFFHIFTGFYMKTPPRFRWELIDTCTHTHIRANFNR